MFDLLFIGLTLIFFAFCQVLVHFFGELMEGK